MNKKNVKLLCNIAGDVLKVVVPIILTSIIASNENAQS